MEVGEERTKAMRHAVVDDTESYVTLDRTRRADAGVGTYVGDRVDDNVTHMGNMHGGVALWGWLRPWSMTSTDRRVCTRWSTSATNQARQLSVYAGGQHAYFIRRGRAQREQTSVREHK